MHWRDFLYYSPVEKVAILILLLIIVFTFWLNVLLSNRKDVFMSIPQNDSLIAAFERLQENVEIENRKIELKSSISDSETKAEKASSSKKIVDNKVVSTENKRTEKHPQKHEYIRQEKFTFPNSISLNEKDTAEWKKIPGIGSAYSARIVKYGKLLGGYNSINQLKEVYGVDDELFRNIAFFVCDDSLDPASCKKININELEFKEILAHPYINYEQTKVIMNLRRRIGRVESIDQLAMLDEFTAADIERIMPYIDF